MMTLSHLPLTSVHFNPEMVYFYLAV